MIWNKYKNYIFGLIVIAFCWVIFIFSAFFLIKQIKIKVNSIQAEKVDQENMRKRIADIPKFEKQSNLVREKEALISGLLNKSQVVDLIEEIENLSEKTGNVIAIEIGENQDGKTNKQTSDKDSKNSKDGKDKKTILSSLPSSDYLKLKIKLNGKYNNLVNFIEKLENLNYYSDIISLQVNSDEEKFKSMSGPKISQINQPDNIEIQIDSNLEMEVVTNIEVVYYLDK